MALFVLLVMFVIWIALKGELSTYAKFVFPTTG